MNRNFNDLNIGWKLAIILGAGLLVPAVVWLGMSLSGPSLEERAVAAGERISAATEKSEQAVADIEAQQAAVQEKMDEAQRVADAASAPYMDGDTPEMRELEAESEELWDAADAADEALINADWDLSDAEYSALEQASEDAWDAAYAKDDEIQALSEEYSDQYDAAQAKLEDDLEPLEKESERLTDLAAAAWDEQYFEMAFSIMASCPELAALGGEDVPVDEKYLRDVELTEGCVVNLETWAEKVSK